MYNYSVVLDIHPLVTFNTGDFACCQGEAGPPGPAGPRGIPVSITSHTYDSSPKGDNKTIFCKLLQKMFGLSKQFKEVRNIEYCAQFIAY